MISDLYHHIHFKLEQFFYTEPTVVLLAVTFPVAFAVIVFPYVYLTKVLDERRRQRKARSFEAVAEDAKNSRQLDYEPRVAEPRRSSPVLDALIIAAIIALLVVLIAPAFDNGGYKRSRPVRSAVTRPSFGH